jgi:hypothetical protein
MIEEVKQSLDKIRMVPPSPPLRTSPVIAPLIQLLSTSNVPSIVEWVQKRRAEMALQSSDDSGLDMYFGHPRGVTTRPRRIFHTKSPSLH